MSGIKDLKRLEASDMLDVFHTLLEEDLIPLYEEHEENKTRMRSSIYKSLYNRDYKYGSKNRSPQTAMGFDPDMELPRATSASSNNSKEIKPYIPPTNPEDLPGILDGPMGG